MKKFAKIALLLIMPFVQVKTFAQETSKDSLEVRIATLDQQVKKLTKKLELKTNLKISGYIQTQWQMTQEKGALTEFNGGSFPLTSNNRFSVQRGRFKLGYSYKNFAGVMQVDVTERGVGIKDAYVSAFTNDKIAGITTGVFNRPFGNEILYSSSSREMPERSRMYQTLFPSERDLGAQLTLQGKEGTFLHKFKFDGGVFAGNGPNVETNSAKDFMGRLEFSSSAFGCMKIALGTSMYAGKVLSETPNSYFFNTKNDSYKLYEGDSYWRYFKRLYGGVNLQMSVKSASGTTSVRAEYIRGQQPGTAFSSKSPKTAVSTDIFCRKFYGQVVYLVHELEKVPLTFAARYDYYDPNRQIESDLIGISRETGIADIAYTTLSASAIWRISPMFRFMVNYEYVMNEKCADLEFKGYDYTKELKDNILTLRFQVKF